MNKRPHVELTNESVLIDSVSSNKHIQQDGVSLLNTERVLLKGDSSRDGKYDDLELIRAAKEGHTEIANSLIAAGASLDI